MLQASGPPNADNSHPPLSYDVVIVWFRRDLRVDDNPALVAALNVSRRVVPFFVWAPEEEGQFQPGRTSRWWTKHSVLDLQRQLCALGSHLIMRRSAERSKGLLQLVQETGAQAVFFNHLYDPISLVSDHEVKQALATRGVQCHTFNGDMLYEPWEVMDPEGQPYTSFDDFWDRVISMPYPPPLPLPAPSAIPPVDPCISTLTAAQVDWFMTAEQEASSDQLRFKWKPGVEGAAKKLEAFLSGRLPLFDHERAKVDRESTSQLSPWIHIGSISMRYIFYRVRQAQVEALAAGVDRNQSCIDFMRQMGYREYGRYLAFNFPFIHERSLLAHLRACPWRLDQAAFKAWRQGQTGYPLVDAAMKQLWSTGWAHNRIRVVAASFMVKNLLLPWQWGLKHFWDAQLDADLENDSLGWQYISGGMADAHPFSFIIDLGPESARLDPDGEYVRRWLPALAQLPTAYIHAPWTAPAEVLAAADVELGVNYPRPIITIQESVLNLQHAVGVLDKSCVTSSERSTKHPYRMPGSVGGGTKPSGSDQIQQPPRSAVDYQYGAAAAAAVDEGVGAVSGSGVSTRDGNRDGQGVSSGQRGRSSEPNSYPTGGGTGSGTGTGTNAALQQYVSHAFGGPGTAAGLTGDSNDRMVAAAAAAATGTGTPTATRSGATCDPEHVVQAQAGASNGTGYHYPKYHRRHGGRHGFYIDVRLVDRDLMLAQLQALRSAARAAAPNNGGGLARVHSPPGLARAAAVAAAMAAPAVEGDSMYQREDDAAARWAAGRRGGSWRRDLGIGGEELEEEEEDSEGSSNDEAMSEEVVSNTVGLSMPQNTACSGQAARGTAAAARRAAALAGMQNGSPRAADVVLEGVEAAAQEHSLQRGTGTAYGHERAQPKHTAVQTMDINGEAAPGSTGGGRDRDTVMADGAPQLLHAGKKRLREVEEIDN
mmetsp:Transcript_6370/g.14137  ORF Transcript_6370/g.14137 Transcript_6370/m.14137 type:complete len:935 (-) Transcript_6370:1153-3957(-)|eukprot:CAMPEP_0202889802 /NCGR_PEP_ID=MMETSP1392-20130828/361_1 /ASSEMBLY_ACC=CAM_ASM_000868 /TAXON_ID=225041 /ORGANISM="Chlamydomonas chlamydogama, Strain SAG 11-48b" /LENGTH=934 /DNA_ID=CAMNT_0049573213 /DNA_START=107 /DNA_END=2911 /DNA_ORIENTATION=-